MYCGVYGVYSVCTVVYIVYVLWWVPVVDSHSSEDVGHGAGFHFVAVLSAAKAVFCAGVEAVDVAAARRHCRHGQVGQRPAVVLHGHAHPQGAPDSRDRDATVWKYVEELSQQVPAGCKYTGD